MESWSLWSMGIPMAAGAVCGLVAVATGGSPLIGYVVYGVFGGLFSGMVVGAGAWVGGLLAIPIVSTPIAAQSRTAQRLVFATCSALSVLAFALGIIYLPMGTSSVVAFGYVGLVVLIIFICSLIYAPRPERTPAP
jgi:hypothetical protein